jgi:hypothetical protein
MVGATILLVVITVVIKVGPALNGSGTGLGRHHGIYAGMQGRPHSNVSRPNTTSGQQSPPQSRAEPLSRCRGVYVAQQQLLHAAGSAMAQWQMHIEAMNKFVLGMNTLEQANQFWNQTRMAARARLRAYATAEAQLSQLTIRCPAPDDWSAPPELQRCEQAVAANWDVLRLAHTALATWRLHAKDMDMLRLGMMSPAHATRMWLTSWHEGQSQVTRYRAALEATRGLGCPRAQA